MENFTGIMKKAWGIAREGAKKFGGSVRSYISEALRFAWREVRMTTITLTLAELTGSEKQISWAKDIRDGMLAALEHPAWAEWANGKVIEVVWDDTIGQAASTFRGAFWEGASRVPETEKPALCESIRTAMVGFISGIESASQIITMHRGDKNGRRGWVSRFAASHVKAAGFDAPTYLLWKG